jgi:16S rRNA (guanine527-N7)-methyltransferase
MFTGRHEQELAEIRSLTHELDRGFRDLHAEVKLIQERRRGESQRSVQDAVRGDIDTLAARHGLPGEAADALNRLVGLVDWGRPNFLPQAGPGERDRGGVRKPSKGMASAVLAESLAGLELAPLRVARRVADIGSGAGFPGLVLAIVLPQARLTLIERIPERCSFLRRTAAELGLENVEVAETDMNQLAGAGDGFDVVTSRKVGRMNTMVELCAPLLAPGGALALWPGTTDFDEEETAVGTAAAERAGLTLAQIVEMEAEKKGRRTMKHLYLFERAREDDVQ